MTINERMTTIGIANQLDWAAAELEAALTAAKERGRTLNDELYYACELAIAYAHSEKDKEWAAKRIEELMPPEQEVADESL